MKRLSIIAGVAALSIGTLANAGIYTDDLSRCIVESTTTEDRANLMKWMFVAMSQHPSVSAFSTVKTADVEAANKIIGELFTHLLTESCVQKARDAIRIEGAGAIQASFGVLGQVASVGLFSDPAVEKAMSGLEKYADKAKLEELSKPVPAGAAK